MRVMARSMVLTLQPMSCDNSFFVACAAPDMRKIHESDISLTPTQERLLGYIAAQTTISGAAQATKKELSQLMGCSVKTIDRAITRMSREGLIKVEPCHSENGGQLSNAYSVVNS